MYALKLGCSAVLCLGLLSACSLSKTTPVDKDTTTEEADPGNPDGCSLSPA